MSKIQITTEVDLKAVLAQLDTPELEAYAKEIDNLLRERKVKNKKARIAELIKKLNEECVLPENDLNHFYQLREKRAEEELSEKELTELFQFIQKEEALRTERIEILGEIASLKGVSLAEINKELGIKNLKRA